MKRLAVLLTVLAALIWLSCIGTLLGAIWTVDPLSHELGATCAVAFLVGLFATVGAGLSWIEVTS